MSLIRNASDDALDAHEATVTASSSSTANPMMASPPTESIDSERTEEDDDELSALASQILSLQEQQEAKEAQKRAPKITIQGPRRNRIGSSAETFNAFETQRLDEMTSTFAVQQYIQQTLPYTMADVAEHITLPKGQDGETWQYEMMRCLSYFETHS